MLKFECVTKCYSDRIYLVGEVVTATKCPAHFKPVGGEPEPKAGEFAGGEPEPKAGEFAGGVRAALDVLDHSNDDHWTAKGLPDMTVLVELFGAPITRKEVEAAVLDFKRIVKDPLE